MRKIFLLITIPLFIFSCSSYRSLDLTKLTTGMTKAEVISVVGRPNRVLAVNDTKDGFQEVLEYRTGRDEIYALEFWNDFLTGYEFLYDDINYRPSLAPPFWYPDYYGRPIVIYSPNYYPNRPSRPTQPNRPNDPSLPSRPETNRPSRPATQTRPEQPIRTTTAPRTDSTTSPAPGGSGSQNRSSTRNN